MAPTSATLLFYFAPDRAAKYCDDRVCLSVRVRVCVCVCVCVCVREHISGTTRPIFTKFLIHITYGRGSVLLCRLCDTLCTSGFMDDVMFAHTFGHMQGCRGNTGTANQPGVQLGVTHFIAYVLPSTSFGWGKGGNVTSAGWQVTLCDPM